jgi:aryl sulfotransferase
MHFSATTGTISTTFSIRNYFQKEFDMSDHRPQCTQKYNSDTSDSGVWTRFEARSDDVFVCTPPKSGTTWVQSICGMLIFGDPAVNPGIGTVSKWLDSKFNDEQAMMALLKSQAHRRYIKTHTPLDGITYDPRCTYLAVHRHPLDVVFSAQNHLKNMKNSSLDRLIADDINVGVQDFVSKPFALDQNIGESLESLIVHYKSFADWISISNIHMFHYADMTRDLRGAVARLSEILDCNFSEELIDAVTLAATFSNMKENASKFAPSADKGIWKDNAQFFESGSSNKWEGVLTEESLAMYDDRMTELLSPEDRSWFEYGSKV